MQKRVSTRWTQNVVELVREGKIWRILKRKEPYEEVEDDYEEGRITGGP